MPSNDPEASALRANFGGWKLDLINALNSDASLKPSDISVAVALIKHLSVESFTAWPNQETLAEITHMTVRNVDKCLNRLRDAGWLSWVRRNRHKSSVYSFNEFKVGQEIARMKREDDERRARNRARKSPGSDMKHSSGRKAALTRTGVQVSTRTTVQANTYREQGRTMSSIHEEGIEG